MNTVLVLKFIFFALAVSPSIPTYLGSYIGVLEGSDHQRPCEGGL